MNVIKKLMNFIKNLFKKKDPKIGSMIPKKGHTLFEVDLGNNTFQKAKFEVDSKTHSKKVVIQKNCIYISCLNEKNLKKIALSKLNIELE